MSTPTAMKKLTMVTAGAVLIGLQMGGAAQAVVLTFDDNTSNIGPIADSYEGLNWSEFSYTNSSLTPAYEDSGYVNGVVSGNYVAFNRYGETATINSSSDFDFSSAYLTAAWNNGLSITVEGLNDGTSIYSETVVVDTTGSTLFDFNYLDVDELRFTSSGGVNAGFEDDRGRDGEQFVLDSFTFNPLPTASDTEGVDTVPGGGVDTVPGGGVDTVPGDGTDPNTPTPIPFEPSPGLGLLTLGAFGAGALLKRKLQRKAKSKNFI